MMTLGPICQTRRSFRLPVPGNKLLDRPLNRVARHPKRGEVYLVQLDKPRPAVILSVDALNRFALDVCVIPFTTVQRGQFSMHVPLRARDPGLERNCWAKCTK